MWLVSFIPWESASATDWLGGWVKRKDGLDTVKKRKFLTLLGLEHRPLRRPAHNQSLSRPTEAFSMIINKLSKEHV
jgi:hypothetical protein